MYKILVSDPISDLGLQQLTTASDVSIDKLTGLSEDELVKIIGDYDALLVRSQTTVTARIIDAATQLKVIGRAGVGVDNIDLDAATRQGVIVINAPDGNTITTCEHTFAMMMSLARHIPQAYAKTISGTWDRKSFVGVELRNKVLGVLGLGRIGTEVARRAKGFEMEIMGYDPFVTAERAEKLGIQLGTVDEIVANADFITVHTPLTKETRHMIGQAQFKIMKKGMRVINCARGGIVDEQALIEAIEQGIVAGAAFDVFEEEPPAADHPFLKHPKVIVTPHLGASTVEAQENVAIDVAEQVLNILRDEPFKNAVNMPPVAQEVMQRIQPYFRLSERLGSALAQMTDGAVREIEIEYAGELADLDVNPLARYAVKGLLTHHLGQDQVNLVNAMHLAKQRDINIVTKKTSAAKNFRNLISITLTTDEEKRWLSGTLHSGYGERIVQIGPYPVDIAPEGHILLVSHQDKPGMIGHVGKLLGSQAINIAAMQVGRTEIGGPAVMVLTLDKPVPDDLMAQFVQMADIKRVREVDLI